MEKVYSKWSQRNTQSTNDAESLGQVVSTKNIWIKSQKITQEVVIENSLRVQKEQERKLNGVHPLCSLCHKPELNNNGETTKMLRLPSISHKTSLVDNLPDKKLRKKRKEIRGRKLNTNIRISLKRKTLGNTNDMLDNDEKASYCDCGEIRQRMKQQQNTFLRENRDPDLRRLCRFPVEEDEDIVKRTLKNHCSSSGDKYSTYTYLLGKFEDTSLSLANHGLSNGWGHVIGGLLSKASHVVTIDLSGNSLGEEGVSEFSKALEFNSTVQTLDLSANDLGNSLAVSWIAHVLDVNKTLRDLTLSRNQLTDLDVEPLLDACAANTSLLRLDVSSNRLGELSSRYFKTLLSTNSTILELDLGCNNLGPKGFKNMFEGLEYNKSLKKLVLSANHIGDRGIDELSTVSSLGSELSYLDLSDNFLTDHAIAGFARFFRSTNSLTGLRIDKNPFTSSGLMPLLQSILDAEAVSLVHLSVGNVFLGEEVKDCLEYIKSANKNFTIHGGYGNVLDSSCALRVLNSYIKRHTFLSSSFDDKLGGKVDDI